MNQADTQALFAQGKEKWNAWAERMLADRKALEEKGEWFAAARADFTGHCFTEVAEFSGFVFPGEADFGPAEGKDEAGKDIRVPTRFEKAAIFIGATFSGDAQFYKATFSGDAGFYKATFSGHAGFGNATFWRSAWFNKATFSGHAGFGNATFSGDAGFDEATFSRDALFDNTTISGDAGFDEATISGDAWFDNTTLSGDTRFVEVTFSGDARFIGATFSGNAKFNLARFEGYTAFENAHFEKAARFVAMKGESFFSLRHATFLAAPDFEQAHFAEAPRLDDSRYPDKAEPGTSARWRALKRLAVQGHDHEREQLFFAQELKSLRGETDWLWPRLQNLLRRGEPVWPGGSRYWLGLFYQGCSDFGRSMVRPVVWWGVLTTVFALIYLDQHFPYKAQPYAPRLNVWMASSATPPLECVKGEASAPLASAIFLAIHKGSIAGLGGSEKLAQTYACLYGEDQSAPASRRQIIPDAVAFAGFVQAILSAPLIFLFLLAVRNHFRIK